MAEIPNPSRPITRADLADFAERTGKAIGDSIRVRDERIAELEAKLAKAAEALESAERRLSRQGEHLARLQDRVKRLETP